MGPKHMRPILASTYDVRSRVVSMLGKRLCRKRTAPEFLANPSTLKRICCNWWLIDLEAWSTGGDNKTFDIALVVASPIDLGDMVVAAVVIPPLKADDAALIGRRSKLARTAGTLRGGRGGMGTCDPAKA